MVAGITKVSVAPRTLIPEPVVQIDRRFNQSLKSLDLVFVMNESFLDVDLESLVVHGAQCFLVPSGGGGMLLKCQCIICGRSTLSHLLDSLGCGSPLVTGTKDESYLFFEFFEGAHPVELLFEFPVRKEIPVAVLSHVPGSSDVFVEVWFDLFESGSDHQRGSEGRFHLFVNVLEGEKFFELNNPFVDLVAVP